MTVVKSQEMKVTKMTLEDNCHMPTDRSDRSLLSSPKIDSLSDNLKLAIVSRTH